VLRWLDSWVMVDFVGKPVGFDFEEVFCLAFTFLMIL
jgi:hypothetical protein